MKPNSLALIVACAAMAGCAHTIPSELVGARQAYEDASAGPASQLVPAEVHKAYVALQEAEQAYEDDPRSYRTRDLAYVAMRKAQMAEVLASIAIEEKNQARATEAFQETQSAMLEETKLAAEQAERQLAATEAARLAAERRASELAAALSELAAVKEEARGLVITLSGSVLFRSDEATLMPEAQGRLDQVAAALLSDRERNLLIEGHTDSQGSDAYNLDLSRRRAEAVRGYLVQRGYNPTLIQAQGIGEAQPVADNATAEGRANNRRVEIVILPGAAVTDAQ